MPPRRPDRLSTIAHADRRVLSPVSDGKLASILGLLELPARARVLDLCCGKAEVLVRILEAHPDATGLGVDLNETYVRDARREARARGVAERVELVHGDAWAYPLEPGAFDAVVSLGGAYRDESRRSFLSALRELVRPDGQVLVGDGFYRRPPEPAELAADGWTVGATPSHADQVALATEVGLVPLHTATSSDDEWDAYEGAYLRAVQRWARAHPEDPEADAMVGFVQWWHQRYLEWRRDTLGFGLYLYAR
ncbi:MAG TPA: class I SAM-dependent methyltransferase [Sandaracinaceae bacterium LLY-WYZ-13_1]|nr:class I SAM-dependent methyltransferase [Sandaracinaceae bacterium LLY-WYZ-13_1]